MSVETARRIQARMSAISVLIFVVLTMPLVHAQEGIEDSFRVDIPSMPLGQALKALADQGDFQIVFAADAVKDLNAPKLTGEMRPEQALATLLAGTKLAYVRVADTYVIKATTAPLAKSKADLSQTSSHETSVQRMAQAGEGSEVMQKAE